MSHGAERQIEWAREGVWRTDILTTPRRAAQHARPSRMMPEPARDMAAPCPAQCLSGTGATSAALSDMNTRESQKFEARKAVADRLRQVFARLTEQLSEGVEELWKRVEGKLRDKGQSD
jgi:hypothetical protein